ncbi:unnamed protein product [Colias eurytheme]|nr:unnamed protein product [Colias eurytheme]
MNTYSNLVRFLYQLCRRWRCGRLAAASAALQDLLGCKRRKHCPGYHVVYAITIEHNPPSTAAAITPNTNTCSNMSAIKTKSFALNTISSKRAAWTRTAQPAVCGALTRSRC